MKEGSKRVGEADRRGERRRNRRGSTRKRETKEKEKEIEEKQDGKGEALEEGNQKRKGNIQKRRQG